MFSFKTLLTLIPSAAAVALPTGHIHGNGNGNGNSSTITAFAPTLIMLTTPAPTSAATTTPSSSIHCDLSYCSNGTSYCHYWAGVSTWNPTGPQPGEIRTTLGPCKVFSAKPTKA